MVKVIIIFICSLFIVSNISVFISALDDESTIILLSVLLTTLITSLLRKKIYTEKENVLESLVSLKINNENYLNCKVSGNMASDFSVDINKIADIKISGSTFCINCLDESKYIIPIGSGSENRELIKSLGNVLQVPLRIEEANNNG